MKNIEWESILKVAASIVFAALITWAVYAIQTTTQVKAYRLSSREGTVEVPAIQVIVQNGWDECMYLPPTITYQEAIRMVDSLNKSLK